MANSQISIKPANHRIYQCPQEKKVELLKRLIDENSSLDILIVTSGDAASLEKSLADEKVRIIEDRELVKDKSLRCEVLLGYDMPIKAIVYMARVSRATEKAFLLLDEQEQKSLHAIETLLGRAIQQERLEGFLYESKAVAKKDFQKTKKLTKEQISEIAKKRHQDATETKKWEKKEKAPNKFLGKDENGKAIFSGKSGERNHRYDGTPKEKYRAPKKVGKTINIKERKSKES